MNINLEKHLEEIENNSASPEGLNKVVKSFIDNHSTRLKAVVSHWEHSEYVRELAIIMGKKREAEALLSNKNTE